MHMCSNFNVYRFLATTRDSWGVGKRRRRRDDDRGPTLSGSAATGSVARVQRLRSLQVRRVARRAEIDQAVKTGGHDEGCSRPWVLLPVTSPVAETFRINWHSCTCDQQATRQPGVAPSVGTQPKAGTTTPNAIPLPPLNESGRGQALADTLQREEEEQRKKKKQNTRLPLPLSHLSLSRSLALALTYILT